MNKYSFNSYTMILFVMINTWYIHGQICLYNHFKTKNIMLYTNAYIRHFLNQKKKKKLDVKEGGIIYKFMDIMYKIHRVIYLSKAYIHIYCL